MTAVYYAKTIFYEADFIKIFTITRGTRLSWYCKCNLTLVYLSYIFYVAMNHPKILFIFIFFSFNLLKIAGELSKIKYWSATVASCLIQEIHFWQTVVPITNLCRSLSSAKSSARVVIVMRFMQYFKITVLIVSTPSHQGRGTKTCLHFSG